jgi:hypothetical protein
MACLTNQISQHSLNIPPIWIPLISDGLPAQRDHYDVIE